MYRVITPQRMQAVEQAFMARTGTPGALLMERAARAVVDVLVEMTPEGAIFLCGPGNNGGDGYAAAWLLAERGRKVLVWALSDPRRTTGDARQNWQRCVELGISVLHLAEMPEEAPQGYGVVVDALFGTGLARPLEGLYADAVRWMNGCGLPVLAVDMPSGTAGCMVQATRTISFHQLKTPHLLFPGRVCAGEVTVADIGILQDESPEDYEVAEVADIPQLLSPRPLDAHKGTCGHALLLAGSWGMAGAAALSANAALRGGAGLVTVACPEAVLPVVQTLAPCATCITPDRLMQVAGGMQAIAAGPGLGAGDAVGEALKVLLDTPCPQVWDADALNWLGAHPQALGERFVITPHPGEAARLLAIRTADVVRDPLTAADALHARFGAIVLLKGATTVIVGAGRRALNVTGTPGMATGGSGDVLTGLICALLAQGIPPFEAAQLGALLHGQAGQAVAEARGIRSMTAMDIIEALHIN